MIILLTTAALNTILTYQRNKIWKNDYTLWGDCVKKSPNKARPHNNLGITLSAEGKIKEAIDHYNQAPRIIPDYVSVYNNRGNAYAKLGQYQLAFEDYNQAIRLKPDYAECYYNWGYAYDKLSQYQLAIEYYNQAIRLNPNYVNAYNNRGVAYLLRGNKKLGCPDAQKACALGNCKLLEMAKGKGDCH